MPSKQLIMLIVPHLIKRKERKKGKINLIYKKKIVVVWFFWPVSSGFTYNTEYRQAGHVDGVWNR